MTTLLSAKRHHTTDYREAISGAKALADATGHAVYAFRHLESTLSPPVWCYSFVVPAYRISGKVHRIDAT